MLNKMSILLAATAVVALSAGAASAGTYNNHGHHNNAALVSVGFGDVAFGYSDGYWDNGHRWHAWRNADEARGYRMHSGSHFHDWHHDRDSDMGWQRH